MRSLARVALVLLAVAAAPISADTLLLPSSLGSVRIRPDETFSPVLIPGALAASYLKTTPSNREIQRAVFEYAAVPASAAAELELKVTSVGFPNMSTVVELYAYDDPADLLLSAGDFDRNMSRISSFVPLIDGTPDESGFLTVLFDVTDLVNAFAGKNLGFQLRLKDDLANTSFDNLVYGFGDTLSDAPPRLITTPIPEPGTALLVALGLAGLSTRRSARARVEG